MSARAYSKIIKVARTIADLEGKGYSDGIADAASDYAEYISGNVIKEYSEK